MATYTVAGHPLNIHQTGISSPELIRAIIQTAGVGASVTITLSGSDDSAVKAHGCLK